MCLLFVPPDTEEECESCLNEYFDEVAANNTEIASNGQEVASKLDESGDLDATEKASVKVDKKADAGPEAELDTGSIRAMQIEDTGLEIETNVAQKSNVTADVGVEVSKENRSSEYPCEIGASATGPTYLGGEVSQISNIYCGNLILSPEMPKMTGVKGQSKFNLMLSIAVLIPVFAFF